MTTLEIAQKYGVPTPETCKELDWKGETLFYWRKSTKRGGVWGIVSAELKGIEHSQYLPAPQQHEIAPLLPLIVEKDKSKYFLDIQTLINGKQYLQYSDDEGFQQEEYCDFFCIQNHHYAEAYAQLYLKLKNENLL